MPFQKTLENGIYIFISLEMVFALTALWAAFTIFRWLDRKFNETGPKNNQRKESLPK